MEKDQRSNAGEKTEAINTRALEKSGLFPLYGQVSASLYFQKLTLAHNAGIVIDLVNTRYYTSK